MDLAVLVSGGRTGSDFFQSLLDGHDEILTFPGIFYFDKFLNNLNNKKINPGALFIEMYAEYFDSRLNSFERHDQLGDNKDQFYLVDKDKFIKKFNEISKKGNINNYNILLNLHLAYAYGKGEDVSKKKLIFLHIHHWHRLKSLKDIKFVLFYTLRDPLVNLSSAFKNWTSYNNSKSFSFRQLFFYYDRIRNGINYCQKFEKKDFYIIKLEDIHLKSEIILKNFCKLFNLKLSDNLYISSYHNKKWWGDTLSKRYLNGINKNYNSKIDESLFFDFDLQYLKSKMSMIYYDYYYLDYRAKNFFIYRPLKMELILLIKAIKNFNMLLILKMIYYSVLRHYLFAKKNNFKNPKNIID